MASLCHPWFTTTNRSYRFPIFWNFHHRLVRYYCLYIHESSVKSPLFSHHQLEKWGVFLRKPQPSTGHGAVPWSLPPRPAVPVVPAGWVLWRPCCGPAMGSWWTSWCTGPKMMPTTRWRMWTLEIWKESCGICRMKSWAVYMDQALWKTLKLLFWGSKKKIMTSSLQKDE